MSKSAAHANEYLKLILWGTPIVDIADSPSSPSTSLYFALHTANPGEDGNQSTSECDYGGYSRIAVTRSSGDFSISGNVANITSVQSFPQCTSGTNIASYFSIGRALTGTGDYFWYGTIVPNISISTGIIPQLGIGTSITEE